MRERKREREKMRAREWEKTTENERGVEKDGGEGGIADLGFRNLAFMMKRF